MTVGAIRNLRADTFVMSTSAITDGVCFHQHQDAITFKRAMFESAAQRILYVDHTKCGRWAMHALLPLSEFDVVVADRAAPADAMERLTDLGLTVAIAEPVDTGQAAE